MPAQVTRTTIVTERANYAILFQGRTGSSFLVDALDRHPDVRAHGEIFAYAMGMLHGRLLAETPWRRAAQMAKLGYRGRPAQMQVDNLASIWSPADRRPVVGFKTKIRDIIDPESFKEQCETADCRFIVMRRRNLVKQALSHVNAERLFQQTQARHGKGDWNLRDEKDRLDAEPVPVAVFDRALRFVTFDDAMLTAFADYVDGPKLELEYADLLDDQHAWFGSIFDFLGVAALELQSTFKKNTSDDLRQAIPNFDELRARYGDTPYGPMFDEVVNA